jgi:hypothetical protein
LKTRSAARPLFGVIFRGLGGPSTAKKVSWRMLLESHTADFSLSLD